MLSTMLAMLARPIRALPQVVGWVEFLLLVMLMVLALPGMLLAMLAMLDRPLPQGVGWVGFLLLVMLMVFALLAMLANQYHRQHPQQRQHHQHHQLSESNLTHPTTSAKVRMERPSISALPMLPHKRC